MISRCRNWKELNLNFRYMIYSLLGICVIIVHAYDTSMWSRVPWPHVEVREGLYGFASFLGFLDGFGNPKQILRLACLLLMLSNLVVLRTTALIEQVYPKWWEGYTFCIQEDYKTTCVCFYQPSKDRAYTFYFAVLSTASMTAGKYMLSCALAGLDWHTYHFGINKD